ncbi:WD40 repeat domain-containing protein [Myxococcus eversor]|uniref:WD40 repeat domain-containing protein n=1 Tax=Myxococcus eversor TaxID=2709661 RepID=UPI0013D6618E|nr:hypothetical protein [Myxococcus eversor]
MMTHLEATPDHAGGLGVSMRGGVVMKQVLRPDNGNRWSLLGRWGTPSQQRAEYQKVGFSPSGHLLVTLEHRGDERLRWWHWQEGRRESLAGEVVVPKGVAMQALPALGGIAVTNTRFELGLYAESCGALLRQAKLPDHESWGLVASADGTRLAMHDQGSGVLLWDTGTWTALGRLAGPQQEVVGLAFSPDGQWLAAACLRGRVVLWNARTGQLAHVHAEEEEQFVNVAFDPSGEQLVATTTGPRIQRFHVGDWSLGGTLSGPVPGSRHAAFSPDGGLLAVTKFGFLVLGVDEGARVFRYEVDNDFYGSNAVFSPDGTTVAWGEPDGTVGLWGIASPS